LDKEDNLLVAKRVDIGVSCKNELKQIEKDKAKLKVTDREILQFKDECRQFIIAMVKKLNERSPLKCAAVRAISSLDPYLISSQPNLAKSRFDEYVQLMLKHWWIEQSSAECATKQFKKLVSKANEGNQFAELFQQFNWTSKESSLDCFYRDILTSKHFPNVIIDLKLLIQKALILSHGQATVESGFSINESLLDTNLQEQSLINLRSIYDAILSQSDGKTLDDFPISQKLKTSCRMASQRYRVHLEENKKKEQTTLTTAEKKRKQLQSELYEVKKKIKLYEKQSDTQREMLVIEQKKIETQLSHLAQCQ
jgi:hypothetical protein